MVIWPSHWKRCLGLSDSSDVVVQVFANDPRSCPTEALLVVVSSATTLAEIEQLPDQLSEECGWGLGYEVSLNKRSGVSEQTASPWSALFWVS